MLSNQMLSKLRDFNLNSYESKIWVALLSKGSATAGSLSELTDVPRSRCYDVLESLEKKGFIIMKVGRPIKYAAVHPEEAIERVKEKLQEEVEEKIKTIDNLKQSDLVEKLKKLTTENNDHTKPEEQTGLVKTRRNVHNHFTSIFKSASEILLATDSQSLLSKSKLLKQAPKNTTIKILTDKQIDKKLLKELKGVAEVKACSSIGRFCVTDKTAAMFLTDSSTNADSLVWVSSQYSIQTLRDLFHSKWQNI